MVHPTSGNGGYGTGRDHARGRKAPLTCPPPRARSKIVGISEMIDRTPAPEASAATIAPAKSGRPNNERSSIGLAKPALDRNKRAHQNQSADRHNTRRRLIPAHAALRQPRKKCRHREAEQQRACKIDAAVMRSARLRQEHAYGNREYRRRCR
jgi:hypothetical protein